MLGEEWTRRIYKQGDAQGTKRNTKKLKWSSTHYYVRKDRDSPLWNHTTHTHKVCRKAPQCTHLPHVSSAAVFSHAAWKLMLQIPPSEHSLIHKIQEKQIQRTTNADPILMPFAVTPLLRPTTPGAVPSVFHGHQPNVITRKVERVPGTKNMTEYGDGIHLPSARLLHKLKCRNQQHLTHVGPLEILFAE